MKKGQAEIYQEKEQLKVQHKSLLEEE